MSFVLLIASIMSMATATPPPTDQSLLLCPANWRPTLRLEAALGTIAHRLNQPKP